MSSGAASPAGGGVSLKDVVQHMLLSVQDAAKHDNAKLCRALVQTLIKEILAGSSDEASKSRRAAVEYGVVQTLVGVVWQFSVTGSEKDITARLHLVVVCLDVILELRPFVRLDTETNVPICVLLRASGVRKLVKSMEQHWALRNRSVPLLSKYMRVLLHVAACEQGTRMLLAAGVHTLILGILTPKTISDKHAILIMLRIVSQIVFHQPSARATFWTHSAVRTILYYGTSAGENNFAVHVEVTSLLCMVSTEQRGAEAILACDPLGYAIKVLHDASLAAPTSALTSGDFEAATALQQELESNTSHESQDYSASMPAKLDVGRGKTPPQGNSPASAPSPPPSPPLTGYAIENLNNTARNAMSVGTQLFSNLIRRPSVSSSTQSPSQSSHSATKLSEEGARSATWAAMLMHNLCASVKDDATMKMVICEAYEANTLTLKTEWHDRPVFQRVSSLMQRLLASSLEEEEQNEPKQNCDKTMSRDLSLGATSPSEGVDLLDFASIQDQGSEQQKQDHHEDGQQDKDEKSPCSRPVSPENIKSEIVATILGTGSNEDAWIGDETIETASLGGLGGLAVLFNISYLEEVYSIRLKEILDALLQHYTTSLVEPEMLPLPVEGSRVLNFIFALMTHPALQERIKRDSIQQEVADFVSITRDLCAAEFSRGVDRAFNVIFDEEKKAVRVLPSILYASFWVGAELDSSSDPLAAGSSSAEEQQTRQALGSPAAGSASSPLNSALHIDTSAAPAPIEKPRRSSIAGLSPTRFGIGDLNANGTSRRKRRQSQNPYTPSISHVALSESTNLIDLDQDANTATASSSTEVSRDDTLSLSSWLEEPHILAVQISLRMEKLYLFTDPSRLVLYALAPDKLENRIQKCPAEHAFLQEYDKLVFWFKDQILAGETSFSRAGVVEGVIDIAICAASDMLQNAALVLACIEALSSSPIRRLEVTWRNVGAKKWERFENLKRLCGVDDDTVSAVEVKSPKVQTASGGTSTGSPQSTKPNDTKADALEFALAGAQPSFFLANARIPYLNGVIVALRFYAKKAKAAGQLPLPPQLKESDLGAASEDDLLAFGSELLPSPKLGARQRSASLDAFDPLGLFGSQDLPSANDIPRGSRLCAQYKILSSWIATIQPNGNWQPRLYAHQPEVPLQIALKELQLPTPNQLEAMTARSVRQEPLWALNQMLLESSYAIESWIESLFDSQVEEEGKRLRASRATVSNQDYLPKSAPLNGGRIQSAAAQIFRTAEPLASAEKETSVLDSLPRVPVVDTGKLVDSLVRDISGKRRARLLQESGSRSAEHWEKLVAHVRLTVERIVLSPLLSRMVLGAMRDNIRPECTLQEKSLYLRSLDHKELVKLLGLPQRKGLSECRWKGAVAALQSFDDVDMPSLKLRILLRVKDSIFSEAASLQVMDMNADEFLPVMTYVLLQAELRHPYATTKLLRELLSDDFVSGETAYYLTTLEIALGSLLEISIPPSATSEVASLLVGSES